MTINIGLLDEESAVEAIETVAEIARENGIDWALVGGLAMALYGSDRTTKDIDLSPTNSYRSKKSANLCKAANVTSLRPIKKKSW